jgi:hypothetical protein
MGLCAQHCCSAATKAAPYRHDVTIVYHECVPSARDGGGGGRIRAEALRASCLAPLPRLTTNLELLQNWCRK